MIDESQLLVLLADLESFRVERTIFTDKRSKLSEAVCAFANDMPGSHLPGYLLIGAHDDTGQPSGLSVSDQLLQNLAGLAADGNILPAPALAAYKVSLTSGAGDIAVVEVQPSDIPPVRYQGKVHIRRGPRSGVANETEERLLAERRIAGHLTFDAQACNSSNLTDLALDLFTSGYRPYAIDREVISENGRPLELQLASLRFFDLARNCPTHAGIILFGTNPLYFEPFAFVQYVRYQGVNAGSDVTSDRFFSGDLLSLLRDLDRFAKEVPTSYPIDESALREKVVHDYPPVALRELLMNAIMHRAYDQPSGVRVLQFADRIEIISPGPLYGLATSANFPRQTSYRNPVIAEAMKVLGFVNRYGRGVEPAQSVLAANGNSPAEFEFGDTFFAAILRARL